jgi:hypothetical protein
MNTCIKPDNSPLPWSVGEWDELPCVKYPVEDLNGWQHWVPQNQYYLDGGAQKDAELICHCVNTHDALVDALEKILIIHHNVDTKLITIHCECYVCCTARAALAAAKGEK